MKADDRFDQLIDWLTRTCAGQKAVLLVGSADKYAFASIAETIGGFPVFLDVCIVGHWEGKTAIFVNGELVEAPEKE